LFVCSVVSVNSAGGLGFTDYAVIGLVHVFVLAGMIYALGSTSGAHFNPAVTLALAVKRKIAWLVVLIYWLVQLAGAVAAALVTKLLLLDEGRAVDYGATTVSEKFLQGKPLGALLVEVIGTFILMWAIMTFAVNPRGERDWAGLGIGMSLGLGVVVFAPLDGAGFNPARSFGPAIVAGEFGDFWVYVVGPAIGAILAALAYTFVVLEPHERQARAPIETLPG
jgi:MIP family channel proteins